MAFTTYASGFSKTIDEQSFINSLVQNFQGEEANPEIGSASINHGLPFSFLHGGKEPGNLDAWKRSVKKLDSTDEKDVREITWLDESTGLQIACEITLFKEFPAVEWVLRFTNTGSSDTPIIENIRPLNLDFKLPESSGVTFHHSLGSTCTETDFMPIDDPVHWHYSKTIGAGSGRSSDPYLPFFNLALPGGGIVGAIGWSGQWDLTINRVHGADMNLNAGQQTTHFTLHPGESIRTPRILLLAWLGDDRLRGHNLLRRLMIEHYLPKIDGEPIRPPLTQNTWFTCNTGNDVTEQNQLEIMKGMPDLGVEAFWIDAGWFEGGWPSGVGSWYPKPDAFPNGLKPLGDAAHRIGMKFVVWFEPERVHPSSSIAREHPEWVLHHPDEADDWGFLFDLGNPDARKWMTDHLSTCISDWGIDVFRNDFNIDPLAFWRFKDEPDRQGISEIRYIEGFYQMWDELLDKHPGLMIDNCASGGRRIDLETCSRSIPLWRSDTQCGHCAREAWDQCQTAGLSLYVPMHSAGLWGFSPYVFRSVATTGASICPDTRDSSFPKEECVDLIEEMKSLRPYWLGDYYPVTAINTNEMLWCGWQLDRPDLAEGFAMIFRRTESPYPVIEVELKGLEPHATYELSFSDSCIVEVKTGDDLKNISVELPKAASVLIIYRKL